MSVDVVVTATAFMDITFIGLESVPRPGEERFAGDLLRSPGGGAINAVGAARLGLSSALAVPLGEDLDGSFIRAALEDEDIALATGAGSRTPTTVVMPWGGERAMVTYEPGTTTRAADVAAFSPRAVVVALDQLDVVPDGTPAYATCGDDDARAFSGRIPSEIGRAAVLFLERSDALLLTGCESLDDALAALGSVVETVIVAHSPRGTVAISGGERIETPCFDTGPAVDTTGDRDLLCAAYAWADLRGAEPRDCIAWAQLYAELAMSVPTATGGAVTEDRLLEEGVTRGLAPPPRAQPR